MTIAIKVPRSVQIRRLYDTGLDAEDIVQVTGYAPAIVKNALLSGRKSPSAPK